MTLYRVRVIIVALSIALIAMGTVLKRMVQGGPLETVFALLPVVGSLGLLTAFLSIALAAKRLPVRPPLPVTSPVTGRWMGMNSPQTKVPSHGIRAYGQAFAIDLVYEPADQQRPVFGSGSAMRPVQDYPAFGEPVRAMIDGVVVRASDWQRDHRARSTWLGVVYMMVEGSIREFGGPGFIVGNHVTIRGADGVYALVAHLKQGSVLVAEGDTVVAGQPIAACGNTGNTSEPHVHAQLMDRASLWTAQGIPFVFRDVRVNAEPDARDALPGNDDHMMIA